MGIFFAIMTALAFAMANIVIKKGIDRANGENNGYLITVTVNVVLLGVFFFAAMVFRESRFHFSWMAFFLFMFAGLLTSGLGRFTLFSAIHRINPSRASAIKNGAPIFTVLFALIILGETLTWQSGIGVLLLLGAILMQGVIYFRQARNGQKEGKGPGEEWIGYMFAVLAAFIFGIGQGVRKQGLLVVNDAFFGAWVGALTAFIFVITYETAKKRLKSTIQKNRQALNGYFITAGILTSIGPLCFFLASSLIQVSFVSIIAAVEPLLTVLLSAVFLRGKEKLTVSVWMAAALVLAGTAIIATET